MSSNASITSTTTLTENGAKTISIASGKTVFGSKSLTFDATKSTDPAELDQFLSKLIPTITTTTLQPTAVTPSSTITTPTTSVVFVTGTPTSSPSPSVISNKNDESTPDLGPIIGGCAGGFILLIILTVVLCIRRKNQKEKEFIFKNFAQTQRSFYRDKDNNVVPITTIQSFQAFQPTISKPPKVLDPAGQGQFDDMSNSTYQINNNDATIKCYNLTTNIETSEKAQISPRIPVTSGLFNAFSPPMSPTHYHTNEPNYTQHTESHYHDHQTETTSITMQPAEINERYQSPAFEEHSVFTNASTADNFTDQSTVVNHQLQPAPRYLNNLSHLQANNNSFLTDVSRYNTTALQQTQFNHINQTNTIPKNKPYQYI
ncbi:hypothetical protein BD560DRAFT_401330 [Blakeslea trispora]|nr:hypothetical protein BD560DRAFT_401330 [Blakeslea trispora]